MKPVMDDNQILDLLEELAESLGLEISHEPIRLDEELGTRPGGFCLFKGRRLIIVNPHVSVREKIRILSEGIKHCDLERIYNKNLQINKRVSALAFKMNPVSGYQVKGTFLGFQTSGELFDTFAKEVKERIKLDIKAVGTIRVDEVYAVAPPEPGKKIA